MADYFVEGGDVLENKLGITDSAMLEKAEEDGRTIRLYLQLLARNAGYLLDYAAVPHEAIIAADKQAFLGSDAKIKELYQKIAYPIPRN